MEQQVARAHYGLRYGYRERFASYYYQVREVLAERPQSVLEVGVGDGVVGTYLRSQALVTYSSADIAEDLAPDIVGSVTKLPCKDKSYDVVCCFEVLEHIPYEKVPTALGELSRVARNAVVLSVPHFGPRLQFMAKVPFLPELRCAVKVPWPRKHTFNGEHYWELGKRGFSPRAFRALLRTFGTVTRDFVPFENQYHHFFVIVPKTNP